MKKRIAALVLAAVLLIGLTACGEKAEKKSVPVVEGRTELYDYNPPAHKTYEMPETIETIVDFRTAWKAVTCRGLADGGTYHDLHLQQMPKARLMDEMIADGYVPEEYSAVMLEVREDDYLITARHSNGQPDEQVFEIGVQFFGMENPKFPWKTVERVNSEMSLGCSREILGKTWEEMLEVLGITEEMCVYLWDYYGTSYSWYEGETDFWYISYEKADLETGMNGLLSLSRIENGHEQKLIVISQDGYVSSITYYESFTSEEGMENLAKYAKKWYTDQEMLGFWDATLMTTGGQEIQLPPETMSLLFEEGGYGVMYLPGDGGEVFFQWQSERLEETENGGQVLYDILVEENTEIASRLALVYHPADQTAVLTDPEDSFTFTFEKTP